MVQLQGGADGACFEMKARLVRYLHEEMGFDVLAWESGLYECDRANEKLAHGDVAPNWENDGLKIAERWWLA